MESYACECESGKYIVVLAKDEEEAISRIRDEYKEKVTRCRKVE